MKTMNDMYDSYVNTMSDNIRVRVALSPEADCEVPIEE